MKFLICFIAIISVISVEAYSNRLGHIDVNAVLQNERLLNVYLKCLLEGRGCTAQGVELKKILPDAIRTGCSKCTDQQKEGAIKVIKYLVKQKPMEWEKLMNKYDPKKIYRTRWASVIQREQ